MAVYAVATVSQIQTLAPSSGDIIFSSGCLAADDGGEGIFSVQSTAPWGPADGGVVISIGTTGLYAVRKLYVSNEVRPEFWGVDGTTAKDLAAFNSALSFLVNAFGSGAIRLSARTYQAGGFVVASNSIALKTCGRATIIAATADNQTILKLSGSNCVWEPLTTSAESFSNVEHFACVPEDETQTSRQVTQNQNEADVLCLGGYLGLRMRNGPFVSGHASTCYWNKFRVYTRNTVWSWWLQESTDGQSGGVNANWLHLLQTNIGNEACNVGIRIDAGTENNITGGCNGVTVSGGPLATPTAIYLTGSGAVFNNFDGFRVEACTRHRYTGAGAIGNRYRGCAIETARSEDIEPPKSEDTQDVSLTPYRTPHSVFQSSDELPAYGNLQVEELYEMRIWDQSAASGGQPWVRLGSSGVFNRGQSYVGGPGGTGQSFLFSCRYTKNAILEIVAQGYDNNGSNFSYRQFMVMEASSGDFQQIGSDILSASIGTPTTWTVSVTRPNPYQIQVTVQYILAGEVNQAAVAAAVRGTLNAI